MSTIAVSRSGARARQLVARAVLLALPLASVPAADALAGASPEAAYAQAPHEAGTPISPSAAARPALRGRAAGDLDGDGRSDLVVAEYSGAKVYLTHAAPGGSHNQFVSSGPGVSVTSVAAGDYDADGYFDLAVGLADANSDDGEVRIYFGGPNGLDLTRYEVLDGASGSGMAFGTTLNAVHLSSTYYYDLVVGSASGPDQGVAIFTGGAPGGVDPTPARVIPAVDVSAVAVGDLNGDARPDLVIGLPYAGAQLLNDDSEVVGTEGELVVYYGTAGGLSHTRHVIHGRAAGVGYGLLGWSLAIGNVNHDRYTDLVAGAPAARNTGEVAVLSGGPHGVSASHRQLVGPDTPGVPGSGHHYDDFGVSVAVGDINGDGVVDLVSGADQKYAGNGYVLVFRGSRHGLTAAHSQRILPSTFSGGGIPGTNLIEYGSALTTLHPRGSRFAYVAIGAPGWAPSSSTFMVGFADVFAGSPSGLTRHGGRRLATTVDFDRFGEALAA